MNMRDFQCLGLIRLGLGMGLAILCAVRAAVAAELITGTDEEAQLPFWEVRTEAMTLRLVQRLPDQTRGFFLARGFTALQADAIANSCLFQTVFHNISTQGQEGVLRYDLRDWHVNFQGDSRSVKTREHWRDAWSGEKVSPAARLALEWALYPTQQSYQAGDYNWGMTTFDMSPGSLFQLDVSWHQQGKRHTFTIDRIECAPDETREPKDSQ